MKKLYTIIAAVLVTIGAYAQAPEKMSYQAVVRGSDDALVTNQAVGMQISILQTTATGTAVYVETQTPNTNVNGLVSLEIGTGNVVSGDFTTIDWSADSYFIKTETDPTGGTSYTITGTSQLLSVPYALHAKTAENVTNDAVDDADASATNELQNLEQVLVIGNNANGNNIINTGQIVIGTDTPNTEASMEIATPLPVIFPSMTQNEVDAIVTPVEGMVQFNTDAHKLQVYGMLTDNTSILNEIFVGTESGPGSFLLDQFLTSPVDGQVIAIELFLKDAGGGFPDIDFMGQGIYTVPSYSNWTWHTFVLNNPIPVTNGGGFSFGFIGPGVDFRTFGTNANYPNGSGCCFPGADDLLFRVHIQPNPGSFGWQNMN
jgi:hypothetical protein